MNIRARTSERALTHTHKQTHTTPICAGSHIFISHDNQFIPFITTTTNRMCSKICYERDNIEKRYMDDFPWQELSLHQ